MAEQIPDVEVIKHERLNISIWLVPVVALLISLWLAYQYFSEMGPEITIEFKSSAGLKAKQSQIRFRDVPIGTVKKITLTEGGQSVIVTARINNDAKQFLNEHAKFWIVKPKIDKSGITGLETLVSGSYIQLESSLGEEYIDEFIGLEEPYLNEHDVKGKYFKLSSPNSYDLEQGSIVFCRNIPVGEIKQVKLSPNADRVVFDIFVKEPYHQYINEQTQFWCMSNFRMDMTKGRLDMTIASSSQILYGGISFSTPAKQLYSYPLADAHIFPLFKSEGEARQKRIGYIANNMHTFQLSFERSLGKLEVGAPIRFSDFQVGHVINVESHYDTNNSMIKSTVLADIDLSTFDNDSNVTLKGIESSLAKGLVAQLSKTNPLIDSFYIDLVFDTNNTYALQDGGKYPIFPTKAVQFEDLQGKVTQLLTSITTLVDSTHKPVHEILGNLNRTLANVNVLTRSQSLKALPAQMGSTLHELQSTLTTMQDVIKSNAKMSDDISASMKEVNKASKALERVLRKIDHKPNALIFGD